MVRGRGHVAPKVSLQWNEMMSEAGLSELKLSSLSYLERSINMLWLIVWELLVEPISLSVIYCMYLKYIY